MKNNFYVLLAMLCCLSGVSASHAQTISTFAGTGTAGYSGDGGAPIAAKLSQPYDVTVSGNNIYICDQANDCIRKVYAGVISTYAGTGTAGYSGDGGPAGAGKLHMPYGIKADGIGT